MISQKESSTEYNPFVIERNDILDCMAYVNKPTAEWESSSNYLNREIDYLKDMVRQLRLELWELKDIVKEKGIMFEESCDEKYAEGWREI